MIQINLIVGSRYLVDRKKIKKIVSEFLSKEKLDRVQVDINIVGSRKIQELNNKYLKRDYVTDVLSFPQHEKNQLTDFPLPKEEHIRLGDIVVCFPKAVEQAKRYGKRVDDQIGFLVEHGLKHLLGRHHHDAV